MLKVIAIVGCLVLVIIVIDGLKRLWCWLVRPCGLVTQWLLPDTCLGGCHPVPRAVRSRRERDPTDRGVSYDHAGLVVEVDAQGRPKTVRSKATISDFVYDHPPDVAPYGPGYEVYERTSTAGLDQAAQDEIKRLRDAYDAIADQSSRAARDAAERLWKKKNALKGT